MTNPDSHIDLVSQAVSGNKEAALVNSPGPGVGRSVICPDCGVTLIRLGSCFSCPACGFGSCG